MAGGDGGDEGGGEGGSHTHASSYTHVERWRARCDAREAVARDGGGDGGDEGGGEGGGKAGGEGGGCEAAHEAARRLRRGSGWKGWRGWRGWRGCRCRSSRLDWDWAAAPMRKRHPQIHRCFTTMERGRRPLAEVLHVTHARTKVSGAHWPLHSLVCPRVLPRTMQRGDNRQLLRVRNL